MRTVTIALKSNGQRVTLPNGRPFVQVAEPTTPATPTATTATTGGSLADGTYSYRVSALSAAGETAASAAVSQVVPAGTATNTVTISWTAVAGATGYKVYGRSGTEALIATLGKVTSYVDTGSVVTPAGAFLTVSTAANTATISIEDLQTIDPDAFVSLIDVVAIGDLPASRRGVTLDNDYANLAAVRAAGFRPGQVELGVGPRDRFILLKAAGVVGAGKVVTWNTGHTGIIVSAGSTTAARFVGVSIGSIADGAYGWVQTDGRTAASVTFGSVGDPLTTGAAGAFAAADVTAPGTDIVVGVSLAAEGTLLRPAGKRHTKIFR
jgi:hypothetical protein